MKIKFNNIEIQIKSKRKIIKDVLLTKFQCNYNCFGQKKYHVVISEVDYETSNELLVRYNVKTTSDKYEYFRNANSLLFESYDSSYILTDAEKNTIYIYIDTIKRPIEQTIIIKLIKHIYFLLTKYNLYNIHCSCCTINNNNNNLIAFIGNKHSGKTTLALHFHASGEYIICDDSLIVDEKLLFAYPNNAPAKAYMDDINNVYGDYHSIIGNSLPYDNNKCQLSLLQERINIKYVKLPDYIIIIEDEKNAIPDIQTLNRNTLYIELLKRSTIEEYCDNKDYLNLLNKLSMKKGYRLIPSINSNLTYQLLSETIWEDKQS